MILERFLDERATSLSFNEVATGTRLSRSTAHRLLTDMTARGMLAQDAQRDEYRLGPLLLAVGALTRQVSGMVEVAMPRMELLRNQFGETTLIAELHGDSVVPIRRVDGIHEMRMNQEIGRRYPAYAGATGQVLLAHLSPEDLTGYLAGARLERLTENTVRSVEELRLALERVRHAGVGISRGQRVAEAVAVSAPVFDGAGTLAGALTISGVASRWDTDRTFIAAQAVKAAAETISRDIGAHPAADGPSADALKDPASRPYALLSQLCEEAWGAAPRLSTAAEAR